MKQINEMFLGSDKKRCWVGSHCPQKGELIFPKNQGTRLHGGTKV